MSEPAAWKIEFPRHWKVSATLVGKPPSDVFQEFCSITPLYLHPAPDHREVMRMALEALEIGYDAVRSEAASYHEAMAGYRQHRHDELDADVQRIAGAITALRAALGGTNE